MNDLIETFLQTAGGDGVDFTAGVDSAPQAHEAHELLSAWLIERGRSIECLLILDRTRSLLRRVVADKAADSQLRSQARGLLRSIRDISKDRPLSDS